MLRLLELCDDDVDVNGNDGNVHENDVDDDYFAGMLLMIIRT